MPDRFDMAPKVELHLHLEGAMPLEGLWGLVERYGDPETRSLEDLGRRFRYRNFEHFIDTWWWMTGFVRSTEDFEWMARTVAESLVTQNIVYAEASISPSDFTRHGLAVGDIAAAVRRGIDAVDGASVGLLVDLVRDTGAERAMRTLDQAIEVVGEAGIVGITIGGSEAGYPPVLFQDHYRKAAAAGLGLTAHAGEAAGAESVWSALRDLGVSRIGHGVRSVEDPTLVEHLVESRIPLEVCPTSNLRTGVVGSWEDHPVFELLDSGAIITINSDDPVFFGSSVAADLREVVARSGVEPMQLTLNAVNASWADPDVKTRLQETVAAGWPSDED